MHDAVMCAEQGVPAAVVVTEPFVELARLTAANFGVPDFPVLVVDHPIFTRDDTWVRATAERLVAEIRAGKLATIS